MKPSLGTLLVVDEDPTFREVVSKGLEDHGYKVYTANGGRPAFEIIKTKKVDAVITDIQMIDGNGAVLLKNIKSLPDQNPYVIFMVQLSDVSLEQAYDMGAEAVFIKPFKIKDMITHLDNILSVSEGENKRTPSRLKVGRGIDIGAVEVSSGENVVLQDLGVGGFAVTNPRSMPKVNDVIPFNIQLSGDLFIFFKGTGVVRWTKPNPKDGDAVSYGLEFKEFDRANSLKATELINFLKTKLLIPKK